MAQFCCNQTGDRNGATLCEHDGETVWPVQQARYVERDVGELRVTIVVVEKQ